MKKSPFQFSAILICFLIVPVVWQSTAWSFVLCIGEDGHSRFEQATGGQCGAAESSCSAPGEFSCTSEHCGPCHDIDASFDSLHGRSRGGDQDFYLSAAPAVLALYSPEIPVFIRELTANLQPQPPPRPADILASLRTTVLRN